MDDTKALDQLLESYLQINVLRPASERQYRLVVRLFQQDRGNLALAEIDVGHLAEWRRQILNRASITTWNNYRTHLRALWRFAMKLQWVSHDPFTMIKSLPAGNRQPKALPVARVRKATELLTEDADAGSLQPRWFWHAVVQTLYTTGMRRRQLVTLQWEHVDLRQHVIKLAAHGSKTRREWSIPITATLAEEFKALHQRTRKIRGRTPRPTDQVFNVTLFHDRYRGKQMTVDQLQGFFRRLSDALGEHISCHRLRHTTGTELVRGPNPDFKAVQQILGHTDLRTTLLYIHPDLDQLRSALTRLPSL